MGLLSSQHTCLAIPQGTHRMSLLPVQAAFDVDITTEAPEPAYPVSLYATVAIGGSSCDCKFFTLHKLPCAWACSREKGRKPWSAC